MWAPALCIKAYVLIESTSEEIFTICYNDILLMIVGHVA